VSKNFSRPRRGRGAGGGTGRGAWLVLCALLGACAAAPRESKPTPVQPPELDAPEPAAPPELGDLRWGLARSARHSLELPLPERESWSLDDRSTPWLVARHERTRSELIARLWRAERLVRPEDCERQARLWNRAIPEVVADAVIEARRAPTPPGWTTELTVGAERAASGHELRGYALAFGSSVGRCYALVYTTVAAGAGAQASVGRRLAIVADEIVPRVRVRSIDERAR
jgi:hypothetical protein